MAIKPKAQDNFCKATMLLFYAVFIIHYMYGAVTRWRRMGGNLTCIVFEDLITQTVALNSETHIPHPPNQFSGLYCCYCLKIRQYEIL
jgi:hypothetical protein